MTTKPKKPSFFKLPSPSLPPPLLTLPLLALLLTFTFCQLAFTRKIYPFIQIAGQNLTGLTPSQAQHRLQTHITPPQQLLLTHSTDSFTLDLATLNFQYDWTASANSAYQIGHTGPLLSRLKTQFQALKTRPHLPLIYHLDHSILDEQITTLADKINIPAIPPQIKLQNNQISISPGQSGQQLDTRALKIAIHNQLAHYSPDPIPLPITHLSQELTPDQLASLKQRAQNLRHKSLTITSPSQDTTINTLTLLNFLDAKSHYHYNQLATWSKNWATTIDRPAQNAKFVFQNGKVTQFQPALPGIATNQTQLTTALTDAISTLETGDQATITISTPTTTTPPAIATQDVNQLGIKELLSTGNSRFKGSISSRIHNITLAASRLNGLLIPPNQVFSFNQQLGEVSLATGYQQAYIIKEGQTILDDGGGVCQISTTLFRAALNAGLPIIERTAHAYRVGYYEQDTGGKPGLDATVYSPTTDLKFKNDTPAHILIQTQVNPKTASLTFQLYGTPDNRVTHIGPIQVWDVTPAPPDLYTDDPTLPAGTVKQIDWAAPGAKSKFTWTVTQAGQALHTKTFYSHYKPWQAKFLRGTEPTQ